ncbi:hypothetical protein QJQ45_002834 [Haematococcus lacustris]|nr:hypothetical protein QJQ45_002834 [Haematococcus lacustris]
MVYQLPTLLPYTGDVYQPHELEQCRRAALAHGLTIFLLPQLAIDMAAVVAASILITRVYNHMVFSSVNANSKTQYGTGQRVQVVLAKSDKNSSGDLDTTLTLLSDKYNAAVYSALTAEKKKEVDEAKEVLAQYLTLLQPVLRQLPGRPLNALATIITDPTWQRRLNRNGNMVTTLAQQLAQAQAPHTDFLPVGPGMDDGLVFLLALQDFPLVAYMGSHKLSQLAAAHCRRTADGQKQVVEVGDMDALAMTLPHQLGTEVLVKAGQLVLFRGNTVHAGNVGVAGSCCARLYGFGRPDTVVDNTTMNTSELGDLYHGLFQPIQGEGNGPKMADWNRRGMAGQSESAQPLTKGQVKHASGLNNARRDTERWLAPIKPHLQHLAAASSAGTSLEANLKHITVTLATWDAVWEVYLDPKWARQRLRLYGAQDRALEQFFNKLEKDMAEVSMKRHGRAKQLVVFFGVACIGTGIGWGADAVLRACCKVVCRPRGRVVLVDEHRTTWVSSAVNGQQSVLLPAKGKEYPGLGYKRLRDKPPKAQQEQPARDIQLQAGVVAAGRAGGRAIREAWKEKAGREEANLLPTQRDIQLQAGVVARARGLREALKRQIENPSGLLGYENAPKLGPNSLLPTAKLQDLSVGALYGSGYRNMQAKVKAADSVIQGMGSRLGPYTGRGVTLGGAMGNTLKTATGSPADSGVVYEYPTGTYTSKSGLPPLAYKPWSTEYVDEYRTPAVMKETLSRMTEHYGTGDALRTSRFQHQGYPPSFNALESSLGKRGQTGPRHESRVVAF